MSLFADKLSEDFFNRLVRERVYPQGQSLSSVCCCVRYLDLNGEKGLSCCRRFNIPGAITASARIATIGLVEATVAAIEATICLDDSSEMERSIAEHSWNRELDAMGSINRPGKRSIS